MNKFEELVQELNDTLSHVDIIPATIMNNRIDLKILGPHHVDCRLNKLIDISRLQGRISFNADKRLEWTPYSEDKYFVAGIEGAGTLLGFTGSDKEYAEILKLLRKLRKYVGLYNEDAYYSPYTIKTLTPTVWLDQNGISFTAPIMGNVFSILSDIYDSREYLGQHPKANLTKKFFANLLTKELEKAVEDMYRRVSYKLPTKKRA
jgi:hypothetical protein